MRIVLMIIAIVFFLTAAFSVAVPFVVNPIALGLAFMALAILV